MNYSDATVWWIIAALGVGTFLIRFSFLGLIGSRPMPPWVLRHLRYTSVAILPGLVAPLVVFPAATDGVPDIARLLAATVTIVIGYKTKGVVRAMLGGAITLFVVQFLLG
ncbi:branched-subunit amino acid transport protein [Litoreibacter meonggei]|uniref:Branched-subunit amino acid transport protein n=1 Tax=Litoreibacter meonggei TaxID=1049199 RepID=A0A497VPY1_9RHOB|nr:AzlD domain-containing protein [Litoreibacter meonggei]RLJ41086.1 branched-subunit amino acid transport protein [Litoreibacter meonggei]